MSTTHADRSVTALASRKPRAVAATSRLQPASLLQSPNVLTRPSRGLALAVRAFSAHWQAARQAPLLRVEATHFVGTPARKCAAIRPGNRNDAGTPRIERSAPAAAGRG